MQLPRLPLRESVSGIKPGSKISSVPLLGIKARPPPGECKTALANSQGLGEASVGL